MLSAEKTPTLWKTLPAFQALIQKLKDHQNNHSSIDAYHIIDAGINKLEEYEEEIQGISAYTVSIGKKFILFIIITDLYTVLNPRLKLHWFRASGTMDLARQTLYDAVSF